MTEDLKLPFSRTFELILPLDIYRKLMAYIDSCDTEITGLGDIKFDPDSDTFTITKLYLLDQHVTKGHCQMEEEAVAKFNLDQIKKGVTQLPQLWWHSHNNFGAFFSGEDEDTTVQNQNETFNISLVVNKKREMSAMMYMAVVIPFLNVYYNVKIDPLPVHVDIEYTEIPAAILKEVQKKVKNPPPAPVVYGNALAATQGFWGSIQKTASEIVEGAASKVQARRNLYKSAKSLPKDKWEAMDRIDKLGLMRYVDDNTKVVTWVDPTNGDVWVDTWGVLPENFGLSPLQIAAGTKTAAQLIGVAGEILNEEEID